MFGEAELRDLEQRRSVAGARVRGALNTLDTLDPAMRPERVFRSAVSIEIDLARQIVDARFVAIMRATW